MTSLSMQTGLHKLSQKTQDRTKCVSRNWDMCMERCQTAWLARRNGHNVFSQRLSSQVDVMPLMARLFSCVTYDRPSREGKSCIYAALPLCHPIICKGGACQEYRGIMSSWLAVDSAEWPFSNASVTVRRRKMQYILQCSKLNSTIQIAHNIDAKAQYLQPKNAIEMQTHYNNSD